MHLPTWKCIFLGRKVSLSLPSSSACFRQLTTLPGNLDMPIQVLHIRNQAPYLMPHETLSLGKFPLVLLRGQLRCHLPHNISVTRLTVDSSSTSPTPCLCLFGVYFFSSCLSPIWSSQKGRKERGREEDIYNHGGLYFKSLNRL